MTRAFFVRPEARLEMLDAYDWYEARHEGLGEGLKRDFRACTEKIVANPLRFARVSARVRRATLDVYPYAVFFQIRRDEIVIHAFIHLRRSPKVWRRRVRGVR